MKIAILFLSLLASCFLHSQTKEEFLQFLTRSISEVAPAIEQNPQVTHLSPPEHLPTLKQIHQMIEKTKDSDLLKLLLQYQLAYRNPENDQIARMLGEIFFNNTSLFEESYERLNANERLLVFPYIKFGWSVVIENKNTSIPSIVEKQKRYDKMARGLINLRGYISKEEIQ